MTFATKLHMDVGYIVILILLLSILVRLKIWMHYLKHSFLLLLIQGVF